MYKVSLEQVVLRHNPFFLNYRVAMGLLVTGWLVSL